MSKPPKIDRKSLKNPDEFVKAGNAILDWVAEHRLPLFSSIIAVVVIVAGIEGYFMWRTDKSDKGWVAYYTANSAPDKDRMDKLKAVAGEYPNTRAGYFAEVGVADLYYKTAEAGTDSSAAAQAADWYGKAVAFSSLIPSEKQLVLIDRGNAYEIAGKLDEAVADYQAAAGMTGDATPLALLNEGRIWEMKKDSTKAQAAFDKVGSDFPNSEYAKQAKNYLRLFKSPLFQGIHSKDS